MDIAAIVSAPDAPPSAWPGWVLALIGGIVATFGGFVTLVVILVFADSVIEGNGKFDVFSGSIAGGIPLLIGMVMFVYGVKRIHASRRRTPPPSPPAPAPAQAGV